MSEGDEPGTSSLLASADSPRRSPWRSRRRVLHNDVVPPLELASRDGRREVREEAEIAADDMERVTQAQLAAEQQRATTPSVRNHCT